MITGLGSRAKIGRRACWFKTGGQPARRTTGAARPPYLPGQAIAASGGVRHRCSAAGMTDTREGWACGGAPQSRCAPVVRWASLTALTGV